MSSKEDFCLLKVTAVSSKKLFYCWILTFLVPLFAYGQWGESKNLVKAKGIISFDKVHPGGCFHVAVIVDITDGWHINAHKPIMYPINWTKK